MDDEVDFWNNIEYAENFSYFHSSFIDLGNQTPTLNPHNPFSVLTEMRRQLSGNDLSFQNFDYGCIWYLYISNQLSKERLLTIFPNEEIDFVSAIADYFLDNKYIGIAKTVFTNLNKYLQKTLTLWARRRKITENTINKIHSFETENELLNYLPELFASDLSASVGEGKSHKRVLLFFDTLSFMGSKV